MVPFQILGGDLDPQIQTPDKEQINVFPQKCSRKKPKTKNQNQNKQTTKQNKQNHPTTNEVTEKDIYSGNLFSV